MKMTMSHAVLSAEDVTAMAAGTVITQVRFITNPNKTMTKVNELERAVIVLLLSAKTPEEVERIWLDNISLFSASGSLSMVLSSTRKRVFRQKMNKQIYSYN